MLRSEGGRKKPEGVGI